MTTSFLSRTWLFVSVLLLTPALFSSAQAQPDRTQNALLWRISGNGLSKPSYLFGTMHVSNKIAFELNRPFFEALQAADVVALEMDPGIWLGMIAENTLFRMGIASQGKGYNLPVQGFYEDAFDVTVPSRIVLQQALGSSPELVNNLLYRVTEGQRDHEESTYLDLFIYQSSRKLGKQVVGLESFDEVVSIIMGALDTGDTDEKDQKRRQERLQEITKDGRSLDAHLEEAYRNQDLLRIDSLVQFMMPSQRAHDVMLGERNDGMLEGMLPLMKERSLFTAVGAAHLPGERGLIQQLRDSGYTVEPQLAAIDPGTTKMRTDLEKRYLAPKLNTHTAEDGSFTIVLPGPIHDLYLAEGLVQLSLDPVNGTSVMLQRIPTYSSMIGTTAEDMISRLDSLIYASVPGRIKERRRIRMNDGSPGFAISSRTAGGEFLLYRIFVTPMEIVMLKVGHSHPKAAKDADRILSSFTFNTSGNGSPQRVEFPAQRLAMDLPPYRLFNIRDRYPLNDNSMGWLDLELQAYDPDEKAHYHVMMATLHDMGHLEEDTFELGRFRYHFADRYKLELLEQVHGQHEGRPSLRASFLRNAKDTIHGFWTLRGPHYTELIVDGPKDAADRFFASMVTLPAPAIKEENVTDGLLHFQTSVPSVNHELMSYKGMMEVFQKAIRSGNSKEDNSQAFRSQEWLYISDVSSEAVNVMFRKEERFERFADTSAYWKDRWKQVVSGMPGEISGQRFWEEDGIRYSEGLITDSTSTRGLRVQFVNKAGATWLLRSVVDVKAGADPWTDKFFSSFAPTDTVFETDLFSDRTSLFFDDILGTDSLRREQAINSIVHVKFEKSDAPRMIQILEEVPFRKDRQWQRERLLGKLGATGATAAVPHLVKSYRQWSDSSDLQLAALAALAANKTATATNAFLDLLLEDTPISDRTWSVNNLFTPYHDTLGLATRLFPRSFDLLRLPEYKPAILNLLAALVDTGLVKPAVYAHLKPTLLADAQVELKRVVAAGNSYNDNYYDEEEGLTSVWAGNFNSIWMWDAERDGKEEVEHNVLKIGPYSEGVERYAHLLLPWYKEPEVKAWFDKVLASKADDQVLLTALHLLDKGHAVDAGIFSRYAEDHGSRIWLREQLQKLGHAELFDEGAFDQQDVVLGYVLSGRHMMPNDSITFLETLEASSRFGTGRVHLLHVLYDGEETPTLFVAGFQPMDSLQVNWDMLHAEYAGEFNEEKFTERREQILEGVAMAGRKRVRLKRWNEHYGSW